MTKTFTQDDIIRYVYDEITDDEKRELAFAMTYDNSLLEFYHELVWLKAQMDGTMMEPGKKPIENVLKYSKALDLPPVHK